MLKDPQPIKEILMHNHITAWIVAAWGYIVSHFSVSGVTAWLTMVLMGLYVTLGAFKVWDEIRRRFGGKRG